MDNILDFLKNNVFPQLLHSVSSSTGESSSKIATALEGVFPVLLASLLKKSSDSNALDNIFNMLQSSSGLKAITAEPADLQNVLGENSEMANLSSQFLNELFGDKVQDATSLLSRFSGVKVSSASTLLLMAAPVLMGVLSKKITDNSLSPASFLSFLKSQKNNIISAVPPGLGDVLGIDELNQLGKVVIQPLKRIGMNEKVENDAVKNKSFLMPLTVLLFLLLAALSTWKFYTPHVATTELNNSTDDVSSGMLESAGNITGGTDGSWAHLGSFFKMSLPNGVELNIPRLGVENKLITAIEDPAPLTNDMVWFSFDRLNFETNSAMLKTDSQEQLKNIAGILKAYPHVTLKLGGYTDNTGNAEANLKLSQERADSVRNALIAQGVNSAQLQAEGYGQEHPIASNDTVEGREQNRRIDVRIVTK